jgi:hypothetical protein
VKTVQGGRERRKLHSRCWFGRRFGSVLPVRAGELRPPVGKLPPVRAGLGQRKQSIRWVVQDGGGPGEAGHPDGDPVAGFESGGRPGRTLPWRSHPPKGTPTCRASSSWSLSSFRSPRPPSWKSATSSRPTARSVRPARPTTSTRSTSTWSATPSPGSSRTRTARPTSRPESSSPTSRARPSTTPSRPPAGSTCRSAATPSRRSGSLPSPTAPRPANTS